MALAMAAGACVGLGLDALAERLGLPWWLPALGVLSFMLGAFIGPLL